MINFFSSEKTLLKNVEVIFDAIAASTSGTMTTGKYEDAEHLELDCKINGVNFSCATGQLEISEGVKIMGKLGKPALGLNISCELNTDIELKMYQIFCKPLFKNGLEELKTHDLDFDRRYYILTRNADVTQRLASNREFQDAARSVLDKHPSLTINERRLVLVGTLSALGKDANKMKGLMVSMAKLAAALNTI